MTDIIGRTSVVQGNIEGYQAMPGTVESYRWIVQGGRIIDGQGTQAILVEWWQNGFGSIELDTTTPDGEIEGLYIGIEIWSRSAFTLKAVSNS